MLEHFAEDALLVCHERFWGVKLRGLTFVHDENFVAADDGVESVSNAENSCTQELLVDQLLNGLLGHDVDVGCGFIQDDNLVAPENGSDYTNELPLANTQILSLVLDLELQTLSILILNFLFGILDFLLSLLVLFFILFRNLLNIFTSVFALILIIFFATTSLFAFLQDPLPSLLLGLLFLFVL